MLSMETKMILHTALRNKFEQKYQLITETAYYFTAKDANHLKQLIKKLKFIIEAKKRISTDETIIEAFELILNSIMIVPELNWYRMNFSIPIINSKLNDIISTIKNGKSNQKSRTAAELADHFRAASKQE